MRSSRKKRLLLATIALELVGWAAARSRGYAVGPATPVRCREGHVFTTVWIPGVSFKALRLGWWRLQRCPVGPHWSLVRPVRRSDLSARERRSAAEVRDTRIP